jgi:hypothetical protein
MECPNEESTWEELADYCWMMQKQCAPPEPRLFFPCVSEKLNSRTRRRLLKYLGPLRSDERNLITFTAPSGPKCDLPFSAEDKKLEKDRKQWLDLWHACRRCKEDEAKQAWIRSPWQQFWSAAWDDSDASAFAVVTFTFGVFGAIWQFIKFYIS